MSNKVKAMMLITITVIAVSVTAVVVILLEPCKYCGDKFCMERCLIVFDDYGNQGVNPNKLQAKTQKTNQKATRLAQTKMANDSYMQNLVFIGDSRTIGLQAFGELPAENIFAEDGLNHEAAMTKKVVKIQEYKTVTIADAVSIRLPEIMIVNFGINGVAWIPPEKFIEGYEALIDQLINASPSSIIVIEAITPVSIGYEGQADGVSNEKIDEVNNLLYELAKSKGLFYLATDEVLKNEYNDLDSSLHNGDGLHYNKAAYDIIINYIKTHAIYKDK